ncbi:MAG: hypothetical protein HQK77_04710 [Desulfobacterales bacterium]|nr:hypothetical protein [Desulfobacterales bacterium]
MTKQISDEFFYNGKQYYRPICTGFVSVDPEYREHVYEMQIKNIRKHRMIYWWNLDLKSRLSSQNENSFLFRMKRALIDWIMGIQYKINSSLALYLVKMKYFFQTKHIDIRVNKLENIAFPQQFGIKYPMGAATDCYRGYNCRFELTDSELFLKEYTVRDLTGNYPPIAGIYPLKKGVCYYCHQPYSCSNFVFEKNCYCPNLICNNCRDKKDGFLACDIFFSRGIYQLNLRMRFSGTIRIEDTVFMLKEGVVTLKSKQP